LIEENWRGKKRWPCHNRVTPIQALLGVESILDGYHQRGSSPSQRQISVMLGLCRSALETERRAGRQQKTLKAWIHPTGTKRPKK